MPLIQPDILDVWDMNVCVVQQVFKDRTTKESVRLVMSRALCPRLMYSSIYKY